MRTVINLIILLCIICALICGSENVPLWLYLVALVIMLGRLSSR